MSAREISADVQAIEHPGWCVLDRCEVRGGEGRHVSTETLIPVQTAEADVVINMQLFDDWLNGHRDGETTLWLSLHQHGWDATGGGELYAQASISPAEARQVAAMLTAYACLAEQTPLYVSGGELIRRLDVVSGGGA